MFRSEMAVDEAAGARTTDVASMGLLPGPAATLIR